MGLQEATGLKFSRKALGAATAIVVLAACASTGGGHQTETYREVAGNLTERWVWGGADPATLEETFAIIKAAPGERSSPDWYDTIIEFGPGHWTYEFSKVADTKLAAGEAAEAAGDSDAAFEAFYSASGYYQIAKFPYTRGDNYAYYLEAYQKSMAAYERAGQHLPTPLEVVEIPYKGNTIRAYLHLAPSANDRAAPIVLVSGGIDTFKVEHLPTVMALNEAGMSALALDLPGVGESNFLDAEFDHDLAFSAALDVVSNDPRIDADKAGIWAASWGGNASARIAFRDERFDAVVAACGPVHEALNIPTWAARLFPGAIRDRVPPVRLDVVTDRVGLPSPLRNGDAVKLAKRVGEFSLIKQGFVGGETKANVPVLVINTDDDPVAPISDMEALADAANDGSVIYTGSGGHCGSRVPLVEQSVPWLASYLIEEKS